MHVCPDELNALWNSLPMVEHLTCSARHAWRWVVSRVRRRAHPVGFDAEIHRTPSVGPRAEVVTVLSLCETERLVLRPNQLYRFVATPGCARCADLARIGAP
jgi:hypothetical protein